MTSHLNSLFTSHLQNCRRERGSEESPKESPPFRNTQTGQREAAENFSHLLNVEMLHEQNILVHFILKGQYFKDDLMVVGE